MSGSLSEKLHGHLWTLGPHVVHVLRPETPPRDVQWRGEVQDPSLGPVTLTGALRIRDPQRLVVIVHGLGGSAESRYILRQARAADRAGLSYLRVNLRGADRSGEDVYHAGMSVDLRAVLASPELANFRDIYIIGFSMGGHVTLRWATEPDRDPRVRAIVAVCAPLDLHYGAEAIQRPSGRPYQWHVLRGLKEMYRAAAQRRAMPAPVAQVEALRTIIEWDDAVIVPRFGFASRAEYYRTTSAGPQLGAVELPTLFVAATADPVVTAPQLRPWLAQASSMVEVAWTRGGHVAFPDNLPLTRHAGPLEAQLIRWLESRGAHRAAEAPNPQMLRHG